jgi:hypothetical protein
MVGGVNPVGQATSAVSNTTIKIVWNAFFTSNLLGLWLFGLEIPLESRWVAVGESVSDLERTVLHGTAESLTQCQPCREC